MTMKINDWIQQNEKLAMAMESYLDEINKLEQFRDLLRQRIYSKRDYQYTIQLAIKKDLENEKHLFEWLNDTYIGDVCNSSDVLKNGGAGFVRMAEDGVERIKMIYPKYRKSSNQIIRSALITLGKA